MEYLYDESGIAGVIHNGTTYLYRKDGQGDIIGLIDNTGNVVVNYVYDAWGQHKVYGADGSKITDAGHIGSLNPIRYRGYYYDTETKLYFLKTRYYDPELCRFVTIDDTAYLDPNAINGLNLYAYCLNNPVMCIDPDGHLPRWLQWLLGGIIIIGAIALSFVTAGLATPIATALGGGVMGVIIGGAVAGAVGGAIAGFGISIGVQGISNGFDNIDWNQVGKATLSGVISGAIMGTLTSGVKVAQAAKLWDKGTFKSGFQSMRYHFKKHGAGFGNILNYTKSATNFATQNSSLFKYTFNFKYGNASWNFTYTNGHGGMFTTIGKIITFW